jgi:zinc transporter ZupT
MSDVIHNFADGMAVGASFATSTRIGISTSIAVAAHEIPHELGNYAILVRSGFTHYEALVFNLISAMPCFIGFYIGAVSSCDQSQACQWIMAITAGMFIFLSLVDILPTILAEPAWGVKQFVLCNLGLWLGFSGMFLLVVFENFISI